MREGILKSLKLTRRGTAASSLVGVIPPGDAAAPLLVPIVKYELGRDEGEAASCFKSLTGEGGWLTGSRLVKASDATGSPEGVRMLICSVPPKGFTRASGGSCRLLCGVTESIDNPAKDKSEAILCTTGR